MKKKVSRRKIANELNLSVSSVRKSFVTPLSMPIELRARILSYAFRQGETWIQKKFPTQIIYLIGETNCTAYAQELYVALSRLVAKEYLRMLTFKSFSLSKNELDAVCSVAPSSIYVFGALPLEFIQYLDTLGVAIIFTNCPLAAPENTLAIDFYTSTEKLATYLKKKGHDVHFAAYKECDSFVNEKLLGYLYAFKITAHAEMDDWVHNLDLGAPKVEFLPHHAIITATYEVAQELRLQYPLQTIACVDLLAHIPKKSDIIVSTLYPNELAEEYILALEKKIRGRFTVHENIEPVIRKEAPKA